MPIFQTDFLKSIDETETINPEIPQELVYEQFQY